MTPVRYCAAFAILTFQLAVAAHANQNQPREAPPEVFPSPATLIVPDSMYLFVRGVRVTGEVPIYYKNGALRVGGAVLHEGITESYAAREYRRLVSYTSGTKIRLIVYSRDAHHGSNDPRPFLADLARLEASGWNYDAFQSATGHQGLLLDFALQNGYKPRPSRTEVSLIKFAAPDTGLLRPIWRLLAPWRFPHEPAVTDSILFGLLRHGIVSAVDIATGRERWTFPNPPSPDFATFEAALSPQGRLLVGSHSNRMTSIDIEEMRIAWDWTLETGRPQLGGMRVLFEVTAASFAEDRIVFGSSDGHLYALDAETGEQRWTFDSGRHGTHHPVVDGPLVYTLLRDGGLVALDAKSGRWQWSADIGALAEGSRPTFWKGLLVVTSYDGTVQAIDTDSRELRWSSMVGRQFLGSAAVDDDVVCVADETGIHGRATADGRHLWTHPEAADNPVLADGRLFCVTRAGELLILDPRNGVVLERHDVVGRCLHAGPVVQGRYVVIPATSDTAGVWTGFELNELAASPGQGRR